MAKSKKSETVFLVCKETGDHNYTLEAQVRRREAHPAEILPPLPQAHRAHGEEEVRAVSYDMSKRWRIHPHDPDRIAALERAAGIPAVVAQLLICRGITDPDAARTFLDPKLSALRDPQLLPGCTAGGAAHRTRRLPPGSGS